MDTTQDILDNILLNLSLEEKISLLTAEDWWRTALIRRDDRVLVPQIKTTDGPNGARGESYVSGVKSACFQCGTCVGASFDKDLAFTVGKEIGKEALSKSANVLLAPTVNVIRSPLGGRNHECYSEDPHLLGAIGAAYINGCQSVGVGATPKHFVANDVENRRRFLTADMSERTLREVYMYPFQLILKLSDPWCFMTSFNKVNGTYVADDSRLLQGVLREEWGYKGTLMSDWNGLYSTVPAMNAGIDLEMPGPSKHRGIKLFQAVKDKLVQESTIDMSVKRVLRLLDRSGRFHGSPEQPEISLANPERDNFIQQSAAEGAVLLRLDDDILPLDVHDASLKVVVVGQHASVPALFGGGSARVDSARAVSPLSGLEKAGVKFQYEPGVPVFAAIPLPSPSILSKTAVAEAVVDHSPGVQTFNGMHKTNLAEKSVKLEFFNGSVVGTNKVHERMMDKTEYMLKEQWPSYLDNDYCSRITFNLTPTTTGAHMLSVLTTGTSKLYIDGQLVFTRPQEEQLQREAFYFFRSTFERRLHYSMQARQTYTVVLESWAATPEALAKSIGGPAIQGAGVGFFQYVDVAAQIDAAAKSAAMADVAIVFTGTTAEFESEGYDRDTLDLTCEQYQLVAAVAAARPTRGTVVVNYSGAPVNMLPFMTRDNGIRAIIQAWFPGQECGDSIASLLTGKINPSGRLPMSWPKAIEDNPSYGNFPAVDDVIFYEEGVFIGYRHYDLPGAPEPLFPFGFGLSYTKFEVCGTSIAAPRVLRGIEGKITVSCLVRNSGPRTGKVVLQFYVQSPTPPGFSPATFENRRTESCLTRPIKELKAFEKVLLRPNESKNVTVDLDRYSVSFYNSAESSWQAVKGTYKVLVGFSAAEIISEVGFSVEDTFTWNGI